jgi:hypothetical protein
MQFSKSGQLLDLIQVGKYYRNKISLDNSSALYATGEIGGGNTPELFGDTLILATPFGGDVFITRIEYKHTGTQELPAPETIKIFPNPAYHLVNIIYNRDALVTLYNLNGQILQQQLLQKETGKLTMDVFNLNPGMYIITLRTELTVVSTNLIKK